MNNDKSNTTLQYGKYHLRRKPNPSHNKNVKIDTIGRLGLSDGRRMWRIDGTTMHPDVVAEKFEIVGRADV